MSAAIKRALKQSSCLTYLPLDLKALRACAFSGASFAGSRDQSSQLGVIILLCDAHNSCSIMRCSSWKRHRITRSALAAEAYAFVSALDFSFTLSYDIKRMIDRDAPALMLADSKCLFDTIATISGAQEKRLLIDIAALRESHANAEVTNAGHASSKRSLADGLTEKARSMHLENAMKSGKIDLQVNQWSMRGGSQ